ncbi:MAG: bifunctional nuclease family protein [Candidatus Zipacnadales bacterium]
MVQMFVSRVALDPQGRALIFLTDENNQQTLPIWIGIAEAQAIVMKMQDQKYPRPLTHDLLKSVIEETGYVVDQVRVTKLDNGTFHARIDLSGPKGMLEIDARPSDAIALALRCDVGIYVAQEVLDEAALPSERAEEEELETFRRLMSTMTDDPSAFDMNLEESSEAGPDEEDSEGQEG